MRITIDDKSLPLIFKFPLKLDDFTDIYSDFIGRRVLAETDKDTMNIEKTGASLLKDGLNDVKDGLNNVVRVNNFVRFVLTGKTVDSTGRIVNKWVDSTGRLVDNPPTGRPVHQGGWAGPTGILGDWMLRNQMLHKKEKQTDTYIAGVVKNAAEALCNKDVKSAIEKITSLYGLKVSFGSKILRMLSPEQVGVYDSVLAEQFCYPKNSDGLVDFCNDCKKVADKLNSLKIEHKHREHGEWFIADVEAVIYYRFRKLNDVCKGIG